MTVRLDALSDDERIKALNNIASLHDDASVSAKEAADFLGISESTLARLRQKGSGPVYAQYPETGSKARNQKVAYVMRDVRGWRDSLKVGSSMAAAKQRGLTFASIADLTREEPFWVREEGSDKGLVAHARTVTAKRYRELWLDDSASIEWMSIDDALQERWLDLEQRALFDDAYADVVASLLARNSKHKVEDSLRTAAKATKTKTKTRV